MAQEIINIGTAANDGTGDPLRVAFSKINNNFSQLFFSGSLIYEATTFNDSPNQVIYEVPTSLFTQAVFQINSSDPSTDNSQNCTLIAAINNAGDAVQWTGHSTIFINDAVTTYDIIVEPLSGNVQVLVSPLANTVINHLISAQVQTGAFTLGTPIGLEGLSGEVLGTENNLILTTES